MRKISEVFQGNADSLKKRCTEAVIETQNPKLIRKFENLFDMLSLDDQIALTTDLLKNSELFY